MIYAPNNDGSTVSVWRDDLPGIANAEKFAVVLDESDLIELLATVQDRPLTLAEAAGE